MKQSKYYNLTSVPSGWTPEEFEFAISSLEGKSSEQLLRLLAHFQIHFSSGNETVDHENLVAVLIDDVPKEKLLSALRSMLF